ncbi:MAG: multicopper oxidase family protein [Pseudonocardiaceae bacterium]
MNLEPISRRRMLGLAAVGAVAVAGGAAGWAAGVGVPRSRLRLGPAAQPLAEPEVLTGRDGVLDVELTAAAGVALAGRDTFASGFNGSSPGPTLRVRPGELLRVRLVNQLDQPTNLHTHGLHVSPERNGDNPFVVVDPGASFDYAYRIPATHPAGTFWYHPHHHGYVADQIFAGLAGALLVDDGPDLPVGRERVLLITDTTLGSSGQVITASPMERMMGREGELVLVNGQHQAMLTARPGASERWRIINGCVSRVLSLRLAGHRPTQVAADGYFLPAPVDRDRVVLSPGNRADVVIHPAAAGDYPLITDPHPRGTPGMGGMGRMDTASAGRGPVTLATLRVTGSPQRPARLPVTLPAPLAPAGPVVRQRALTFAMGMRGMGMGGMTFTIDGRSFDPHRVDQTVRLGSTEEWVLSNTSPLEHSFHLHVWPFQVIGGSAGTPPQGTLQDVVVVPARGWVRLRIRFADYPGRSVYHCHTLDHEDAGMMATIQVDR